MNGYRHAFGNLFLRKPDWLFRTFGLQEPDLPVRLGTDIVTPTVELGRVGAFVVRQTYHDRLITGPAGAASNTFNPDISVGEGEAAIVTCDVDLVNLAGGDEASYIQLEYGIGSNNISVATLTWNEFQLRRSYPHRLLTGGNPILMHRVPGDIRVHRLTIRFGDLVGVTQYRFRAHATTFPLELVYANL